MAVTMAVAALQLSAAVPQQAPTCAPPQRRSAAVGIARGINTAQAMEYPKTKTYRSLDELSGLVTVPPGFAVQLVTNSTGYIFTVKDEEDACGFGLFSDQKGVIYLGETMK
jgi:hypothetical protein